MTHRATGTPHQRYRGAFAAFVLMLTAAAPAAAAMHGAEALLAAYREAKSTLDNPTPEHPFYLHAEVKDYVQTGEAAVYFDQSVDEIADALSKPGNWCQVLLLHINTKACTHATADGRDVLTIYLGRKYYQEPGDAFVMSYDFESHRDGDYFSALITAAEGPLGTSDYRIHLEVIAVGEKTFGRIRVAQKHSWISSKAAKLYVATKGRNKQGISVVGYDGSGNPVYSSGERAVAERNLLRYHFAFTAFFRAQERPRKERFEDSLSYWFDQTEQYEQLHEVERNQYLSDKIKELNNQLALQRVLDDEERHARKDH